MGPFDRTFPYAKKEETGFEENEYKPYLNKYKKDEIDSL